MTPRFLAMWPFIVEWEGATYENDPDDPGGATKFGIDQRSHPRENIRNLTETRAKEIYWSDYWQKNGCEERPAPLGEVYYNACVNTGPGRAAKLLAESKGDADGFLKAQDDFYRRLVEARPKSKKYLRGWLNRVAALRRHLSI